MLTTALLIGSILLSLGCGVSCLAIYLAQSRSKQLRLGRVDAIALTVARKGSAKQKSETYENFQKQRIFLEKIVGFRRISKSHQSSGMLRILLITFPIGIISLLLSYRVTTGLTAFLIFIGVWLGSTRFIFYRMDVKYTQLLFQQLPDALGMIVRTLRVGVPLSRALSVVSEEAEQPTAGEFTDLVKDIEVGRNLSDALRTLSSRTSLQEYRYFATVMSLQSQTGGTLADVIESLAEIVRQRILLKKRGRALSSEARLSSYVIASLPIILAIALTVLTPSYLDIFLDTHAGNILLGVAVGMLTLGLLSIYYLMKRILG